LLGQSVDSSTAAKQETPSLDLQTVKVTFSDPDMNHPIPSASRIVGGPPQCGPDGRIFLDFRVPPPLYNYSVLRSVSPSDAKTADYPVERIVGLTKTVLDSYDPGVSAVTMILRARPAGQSGGAASSGYYLALYNYDGEFREYSKLDLDFQPVQVSQFTDDSFLVVGSDLKEGKSHFVLIDSRGKLLRDLSAGSILPSDEKLKSMMGGMNFAGPKMETYSPVERTYMTLSTFRYAHSNQGLLILEPGAAAQVVELLRTGEVRTVKLKLPKQQIADSMFAGRDKWYVRAFLEGTDNQYSLYQVDPETGNATAKIDTSGVSLGSIACFQDAGFSALRWVDGKAYLMHGDLR
jgi:hypothetical protein